MAVTFCWQTGLKRNYLLAVRDELAESEVKKPFGLWFWTIVFLLVLVLGAIGWPRFAKVSVNAEMTRNLSNAKQYGLACKLFAEDHGGALPQNWSELAPDYLTREMLDKGRYRDPDSGAYYDWVFYQKAMNVPGETVMISSPLPYFHERKVYQIVVIRTNQTGSIMKNTEFISTIARQIREQSAVLTNIR